MQENLQPRWEAYSAPQILSWWGGGLGEGLLPQAVGPIEKSWVRHCVSDLGFF